MTRAFNPELPQRGSGHQGVLPTARRVATRCRAANLPGCAAQLACSIQFTTRNPATRANSRTLRVSGARWPQGGVAAIRVSMPGPMGWPRASSAARSVAAPAPRRRRRMGKAVCTARKTRPARRCVAQRLRSADGPDQAAQLGRQRWRVRRFLAGRWACRRWHHLGLCRGSSS